MLFSMNETRTNDFLETEGLEKLMRQYAITASTKTREQRIAERDQLSEANSRKKVARADHERASYYNQYSEKKWGVASSYDLCVDTDKFGIDGTAEMLSEIILHDFIRLNRS